jgi:hypothetical protein
VSTILTLMRRGYKRPVTNGPETSKAAASTAPERLAKHNFVVLWAFNRHQDGLTDDEVTVIAGILGHNGARPICSRLRKWGLIEPTGEKRLSREGRSNMVCRLTPAGEEAFTALAS